MSFVVVLLIEADPAMSPHLGPVTEGVVMDDGDLAIALAGAARDLLVTVRDTALVTGRELGGLGDALSQRLLAAGLTAHRPNDAVLSEEALDDTERITRDRA